MNSHPIQPALATLATASADKLVPCPTCGGPSLYAPRNVYRPFCSHRCQQGDLGRWASEEFKLEDPTPSQDLTD
jgi:hypothetical protein